MLLFAKNVEKKEGPQPAPESKANCNIILKKLKIALELKNEDLTEIFKSVDVEMNSYELTGYFRKSDHRNYRPCSETHLRAFLKGLKIKKQSL